MLCKLSFKNIKRSFKDYAIYFTTLILGVCIFYIFNSIDSQTAMLTVSKRQGEMIQLLTNTLSYVSVFVSFILGFLVIYASRFLIKKRNKEFGVYMTLGMSKRRISLLLLIETFLIGLVSLAVGLGLGIVLSQITSIFVANMFEADMTRFKFNFSSAALIKTILYFSIIYIIVMVFNTIIINKNKLINLLQASKKQEKVRLKNPIVCILLFIISVSILGFSYYMVTDGLNSFLTSADKLFIPIILGVIGTILFFYSISGMILKILSKCHRLYCKKLNTFTFKQISSKVNTMVMSISIICVMLFFTLCLLSSAFTIKNYFNDSINKYSPVDFEVGTDTDIDLLKELEKDSIIKKNIKDVKMIKVYYDDNFTLGDSLGEYKDIIVKNHPLVELNKSVSIMKESDYNLLAKYFNLQKININKGEYANVSNYETSMYEDIISKNTYMNIYGNELKPHNKIVDGFMVLGSNPTNFGFFVVKDNIISNDRKYSQIVFGNYNSKDKETITYINDKISEYNELDKYFSETKDNIRELSSGLSATVTFIGLYLGIIFLISSSAILALKELSDCIDDKNKYKVLRQIGADEKEINKTLFYQTLILFMTPLSLSIVHTIFGLKFCTFILKSVGIESVLDGSVMTFIFLLLIYGLYFIITYMCGKNIIKERA